MDDLIRRKDALYWAEGGCHPANVAEEIRRLPSAQRWIPVSERLPENETGRTYLVTLDDKYCPITYMAVRENNQWICAPVWDGKRWGFSDDIFLLDDTKITAWKPLPKPFGKTEQVRDDDERNR